MHAAGIRTPNSDNLQLNDVFHGKLKSLRKRNLDEVIGCLEIRCVVRQPIELFYAMCTMQRRHENTNRNEHCELYSHKNK